MIAARRLFIMDGGGENGGRMMGEIISTQPLLIIKWRRRDGRMMGGMMIWEGDTTINYQYINVIHGGEEYKADNHKLTEHIARVFSTK